MKITILSVTSQFIHSALAPWYLKAALPNHDVTVFETSINEPVEESTRQVFSTMPDLLCVPCYIWNIEYVKRLCCDLKKMLPETRIFFGGPEVSFDAENILTENYWLDAVLCGEGEELLPKAIDGLKSGNMPDGVMFRNGAAIAGNDIYQYVSDLSSVISPYTPKMLSTLSGRLAYYESSRGCPFSCAYCLSSATSGVRYFPIERVKKELLLLSRANVRTVKIVDRTFNANPRRACDILEFILSNTGDTCFHLEIGADLIDDSFKALLSRAPIGKIRLEAGVQSTNCHVLSNVARKTRMPELKENLAEIIKNGNVCVHADLICGLPGEDYESFRNSFNDLFALRPHELQMGFLKLLKGSALEREHDLTGCAFSEFPPYTVLKTAQLSCEQISKLHRIEDMLEKFYNSRRFNSSLDYLAEFHESAFDLFVKLSDFTELKNLTYSRLSAQALYKFLLEFGQTVTGLDEEKLKLLLRLDYYSCVFSGRPTPEIDSDLPVNFKDMCFEFLKDPDNIRLHFPHYAQLAPKAIYKLLRFVPFSHDVLSREFTREECILAFDPALRSPVTGSITPVKI